MREIEKRFEILSRRGEGALVSYVMAGDPKIETTLKIADALIEGGTDILELGIPFSDPVADGPTIQSAGLRALKNRTTPLMVLNAAHKIKTRHNTPIVILTYYNLIFRMGLHNFFQNAKMNLIDGVIVPDLPVEEAEEYKKIAVRNKIDTIFLASPSTSIDRLKTIINQTSGFLYLVSLYGITGARQNLPNASINLIRKFSRYTSKKIPLCVGFGISLPDQVRTAIKHGADGVIVGSMFVNLIKKRITNERAMLNAIRTYAAKLKKSTLV
jgi:tryptophan synthase alpha chain